MGPKKFSGVCEYTLSHTYMLDELDERWFRVQVMQERRRQLRRVAFVQYIRIIVNGPMGGKDNIIIGPNRMIRV